MKKKIVIMCTALLVCVVVFTLNFFNPNRLEPDHPAGKRIHYTKVDNEEVKQNTDGRFVYELVAHDRRGREKTMSFTTSKKLRKGAYIKLYSTRLRGVTYWQEVAYKDLPESVKEIYEP